MAQFSRSQIVHLAQLAHLELSEAEIAVYQRELAVIVDFVDQLQQVDISGVAPTEQVTGLTNVMRADQVKVELALPWSAIYQNIHQADQQQFKVAKIKS